MGRGKLLCAIVLDAVTASYASTWVPPRARKIGFKFRCEHESNGTPKEVPRPAPRNGGGTSPPLRRGKSRHVASVCLVLLRSSTACANAIRKGVAAMPTESERQFLKALAASPIPSGIPELRKFMIEFAPMMNGDPPAIGAFHEEVELRSGLHADVAVPKGAGPFPVVVYLHGGGWVTGSPQSHRKLGMQFAEAGFLTINVDYRLAPEHPFPAGLDDCVFAIKWAGENAKKWGGDANRIAVGGDSAGGNLTAAAVTALAS